MGVGACRSECRASAVCEDDPSAEDVPVVLQFEVEHIGAPAWSSKTPLHATCEPSKAKRHRRPARCSLSAPSQKQRTSQARCSFDCYPPGADPIQRSRSAPVLDTSPRMCKTHVDAEYTRWCNSCKAEGTDLFISPFDQRQYCKWCWIAADFNESGLPPSKWHPWPLVEIEVVYAWGPEELAAAWCGRELPTLPPASTTTGRGSSSDRAPTTSAQEADILSAIPIQLKPDVVGPHAREQVRHLKAQPGQLIQEKFRILDHLGRGSFAEAYLAEDTMRQRKVCLKRHSLFDVESLADLVVIDQRLRQVDPEDSYFPRLHEVFFDGLGWTVESLVQGLDLQVKSAGDPRFFAEVPHLRLVAQGVLNGLALLEEAGIVHNDLKPDNIMWVEGQSGTSCVRIVDFNCARLDRPEDPEQNWNLREGGIGCRAYCSPEMALGLQVTHSSDIWSLAVVLSELYSGRPSGLVLCSDRDAVQVSIAQALGLCNMHEGIPSSFLLRSPLTLKRNFTPAFTPLRGHLPLRLSRNVEMEALRPIQFGLDHLFCEALTPRRLGPSKNDEVKMFREFLQVCFVWDGLSRPTARKLLTRCSSGFLGRGGAAKVSSVKRAAKPP